MQLARVIGVSRREREGREPHGTKLLVLQPLAASGEPVGRTLVALDSVGAGVGENVFFVRGREAAFPFYPAEPPTDATIIGIVDHWHSSDGKVHGLAPCRSPASSAPSSRRRRTASSRGRSCCWCSRLARPRDARRAARRDAARHRLGWCGHRREGPRRDRGQGRRRRARQEGRRRRRRHHRHCRYGHAEAISPWTKRRCARWCGRRSRRASRGAGADPLAGSAPSHVHRARQPHPVRAPAVRRPVPDRTDGSLQPLWLLPVPRTLIRALAFCSPAGFPRLSSRSSRPAATSSSMTAPSPLTADELVRRLRAKRAWCAC